MPLGFFKRKFRNSGNVAYEEKWVLGRDDTRRFAIVSEQIPSYMIQGPGMIPHDGYDAREPALFYGTTISVLPVQGTGQFAGTATLGPLIMPADNLGAINSKG